MAELKAKIKINSIQMLRGFAALAVVIAHCIRAYTVNRPEPMANLQSSLFNCSIFYNGLGVGVDIFFIISGFIMVWISAPYLSGQKSTFNFLKHRILRIYPPYLIVTFSLIILLIIDKQLYGILSYDLTARRLFGALTLFPTFNVEHEVQPILGVGWTLSYEIYFYVLFFLSISFFKKHYILAISCGFALINIFCAYSGKYGALVVFLSNPIVFEFIFGCFIGWVFIKNKLPKIPVIITILSLLFIFIGGHYFSAFPAYRVLYWGIPAALIVSYFLNKERNGELVVHKSLVFLGNASYSIYLVHVVIIYKVAQALILKVGFTKFQMPIDLAILITLISAISLGIAFHLIFEKRMNLFFQRF